MNENIAWYVLGRIETLAEMESIPQKKKQFESIQEIIWDALDDKRVQKHTCETCKYQSTEDGEHPCITCKGRYMDMWRGK